tara:strand:- start:78 stop:380 length:303 start_codon:yes stop_codon:yes gene_type:complete
MKLPKHVRVAGYNCNIVRAPLDGDFGAFDANTNTIEIDDAISSDALEASTVLHETVHAIMHIYRIKVPDEEALAEILETALLQFLKDNKTLVRAILKALK